VDLLIIFGFFLFGLVFGSFLNVCIYRMPRGLSVVSPRSACPACHAPIAGYDNIPVLSWLILGGKCRNCKVRISPRYAAVELLTGGFFVLSYWTAFSFPHNFPEPAPSAVRLCLLSFLLIGLIFTDAETQLLPDLLTLPGLVLGLGFSFLAPVEMCPDLERSSGPVGSLLSNDFGWRILSFSNSVTGTIFGVAFMWGVALLYRGIRGKEGMGMGDVKLMAMIGAFLGIELTLFVVMLGSVIGSLFGITLMLMVFRKRLARNRRRRNIPPELVRPRAWHSATLIFRHIQIPFGVFLGAAALVAAFVGGPLMRWYLGLCQ
jgi:leader peptidase (prepilin peptidase) / N-methyltransferase